MFIGMFIDFICIHHQRKNSYENKQCHHLEFHSRRERERKRERENEKGKERREGVNSIDLQLYWSMVILNRNIF